MPKNLSKILNREDINAVCINTMTAWLIGKTANVLANSVFHYNLNQYNLVDHLMIGTGLGTLAYKKAGGGFKGLAAGLIAGTMFSAAWETFENSYVWKGSLLNMDTLSDVAAVYAGNAIGFLTEKLKARKKK